MRIDFFGLPGAGKSTLLRAVLAHNPQYVNARTIHPGWGLLYMLHHPINAAYWIRTLVVEAYRSHTVKLLRFKCSLLVHTFAQVYGVPTGKITVLDEGSVHRVCSFFETKQSADALANALAHMPLPDVLIEVVSHEPLFTRYNNRENDRALLGEAYLAKWQTVVRHNYARLLEVLQERGIAYYTYDRTTATVEDICAHITNHE